MPPWSDSTAGGDRTHRPPRSKNGCLTCKRRRVRCNEQRPRCSHCERLNLQCTWRPTYSNIESSTVAPTLASSLERASLEVSQNTLDLWDFNDIIWQDTSALNSVSLDWFSKDGPSNVDTATVDGSSVISPIATSPNPVILGAHCNTSVGFGSPTSSADLGGHVLVEHFLASVVPPILSSVEIGPRWTSTKMLFASLAGESSMVRYAIMAFSALQIGHQDDSRREHQVLYDKASIQFSSYMSVSRTDPETIASEFHFALATGFFLAYDALLTNRVNEAQSLLRDAAGLVRTYKAKSLSLIEKRLISWIRLVDGRASSAGGDGAFLMETESDAYSPSAHQRPLMSEGSSVTAAVSVDGEIEEVLFDVLYTPGLVFYQRVQSIMARVSNIDPWHRTRGTVQDETEVMGLAEIIRKDLLALERQRPALIDHAVSGTLTEKHLAKHIAAAITRSYRTYWANYEAGYIHLHRVAHKHLPATAEVLRARVTIKRIARSFEETTESLPVNFIWPLLMACCEEDNIDDRMWMIQAIRGMQSMASNAKPIADVLEEVHRRQDTTKQRVDVRQTSMDLFNMAFAVV